MACNCGGRRPSAPAAQAKVDYTPPTGGQTVRMSMAEAERAKRRNGGGTIRPA